MPPVVFWYRPSKFKPLDMITVIDLSIQAQIKVEAYYNLRFLIQAKVIASVILIHELSLIKCDKSEKRTL